MSLLDKKLSRTRTSRTVVSKQQTKRPVPVVVKSLTWDYLRKCKHDLTNTTSCAMCKLVQRSTDIYLEEERRKNIAVKTEGFMKRAEMRLSLLDMWWRNQMCTCYNMLPLITGEVTLCSGVAEALGNCTVDDIHDLNKFMEKRVRILEVGYYAAVTIQRIIRGHCSRLRTVEYLLLRFEYIHPTQRTEAYYIDRETNEIWDWPPLLIDHTRPASPRTLQRRISAANRIRNQRSRQLTSLLDANIWRTQEQTAVYARQLIILRDVLLCLMRTITTRRKEAGERPPPSDAVSRSAVFFPMWFTISNPAPFSRHIYLSLVLETPPLDPESDVVIEEGEVEEISLNDRFRILESRIYETMKSETPEDIIRKLSCEEISPALSSVAQIAEDEYNIWNGSFVPPSSYDSHDSAAAATPSVDTHVPPKLLLPIQLQLHPYYDNRSPMGIFRLFFVNNELFLVSQASVWAFYSEVWKLRNGVVKAIQGYADDAATKSMLQLLYQQANPPPVNDTVEVMTSTTAPSTARSGPLTDRSVPATARSIPAATPSATPRLSTIPSIQQSHSLKPSGPPACLSIVTPDASDIYGSPYQITTASLAPSEFSRAESKYEFVKRMSIWKAHKKNAKRSREHIKSLVVDDGLNEIEPKITAMPPNEHLLGTAIFKHTFQDVPESSIPTSDLHLAETLGSGAYSGLLRRGLNNSDTNMKKRINFPDDNVINGQSRQLIAPPSLLYDITVIEVHITFPTREPKDTNNQSVPNKAKSLPPIDNKWKVELHQVVGVFSSQCERCPAGLDMGHFTWEKMQELLGDMRRTKAAETANAASALTTPSSAIPALHKQPSLETAQWVSIGNQTGVSKLRTMSYSHVNHFRMLSKPPTREYVEKNVPRKIRYWLGMKY